MYVMAIPMVGCFPPSREISAELPGQVLVPSHDASAVVLGPVPGIRATSLPRHATGRGYDAGTARLLVGSAATAR